MFNNNLLNTSEMLYSPGEETFGFEEEQNLMSTHYNLLNYPTTFFPTYPSPQSNHYTTITTPSAPSTSDVMLPNVFVQIPLHNTTSNRSYLRHQHSNNSQRSSSTLVKSEPIKFEVEATTSQPHKNVSPPVTISSLNPASYIVTPAALVTARPKASIKCFKCTVCPFISISQNALDLHTETCHQLTNCCPAKKKLSCPGCDNVFYSKKSLKTHLVNDHQMNASDIKVLLNSLLPVTENPNVETDNDEDDDGDVEDDGDNESVDAVAEHQQQDTEPKQKIYLKNVEVLKNPTYGNESLNSTVGIPLNDGESSYTFGNQYDATQSSSNPAQINEDSVECLIDLIDDDLTVTEEEQTDVDASSLNVINLDQSTRIDFQNKIFVKNDHLLKDPITLENQYYPTQQFGCNNVDGNEQQFVEMNNAIEMPTPPPPLLLLPPPQSSQTPQPSSSTILSQPLQSLTPSPQNIFTTSGIFNCTLNTNISQQQQQQQQQSNVDSSSSLPIMLKKPSKIFIKNVDILRKPMFLHSNSGNSMSPQPQQFFNSSLITSLTSTALATLTTTSPPTTSTISSFVNDNLQPFTFTSTSPSIPVSQSQHYNMPTSITPPSYNNNNISGGSSGSNSSSNSNHQKKIFIKNIDILKQPIENCTNFLNRKFPLHLRTVDELNLMNIDEVQTLIENLQEEGSSSSVGGSTTNTGNTDANNEGDTPIDLNPNEPDDYHEIPDYLNNIGYDDQQENDVECLDSVIQDFVTDFRSDSTNDPNGTNFQYSISLQMQQQQQQQIQQQQIQQQPQQQFDSNSVNTNCPNNVIDFHTNTMQLYGSERSMVFENVTDSTTSSIDEKTNKTEQIRPDSTPDVSGGTAPVLYYSATEFQEDFQRSMTTIDESVNESTNCMTSLLSDEHNFNHCHQPQQQQHQFQEQNRESDHTITEIDEDIQFICGDDNNDNATNSDRTRNDSNDEKINKCMGNNINDDITPQPKTKGRIYVVSNLLKESVATANNEQHEHQQQQQQQHQPENETIDVETVSESNDQETDENSEILFVSEESDAKPKRKVKQKIGRPRGHRKIDSVQKSKIDGLNVKEPSLYKCTHECAMRFKSRDTLKLHESCHDPNNKHRIICPECNEMNFKVWNTLHTHLWRSHKIDMELYACELCDFRTPILSRLINTHKRIHSDERNFKCTLCEKAFKNTKQLKNHRRIHSQVVTIRKCDICDIMFYSQRHLTDHIRSTHKRLDEYKCKICDSMFSSINARETHMMNHKRTLAKYKCLNCNYKSNDNNAYRRHMMTHSDTLSNGYNCPHCDFKSIQSSTYMKHILRKHAQFANESIFSCDKCKFITINQRKYDLHVLNHNYAKAAKSPTALVIVEPLNCDDNVIEVPFNDDDNANNDNSNHYTTIESNNENNVIVIKKNDKNNEIKITSGVS